METEELSCKSDRALQLSPLHSSAGLAEITAGAEKENNGFPILKQPSEADSSNKQRELHRTFLSQKCSTDQKIPPKSSLFCYFYETKTKSLQIIILKCCAINRYGRISNFLTTVSSNLCSTALHLNYC